MNIEREQRWYWRIDICGVSFVTGVHKVSGDGHYPPANRSRIHDTEAEARAGLIAEMKRIHASITAQIEYLEALK